MLEISGDNGQESIVKLVIAFNEALNAHDPGRMMRMMAADCVFENTYPPPDGERYAGWEAVLGFWEDFFRLDEGQTIEIEEIFALGERCVMRWVYRWGAGENAGHVRGVDVYRVRDGLIVEKLSYVKG